MEDKQYTEQEITAMADAAYDRCKGCFHCERYKPVHYGRGNNLMKINKLFTCSNPGCYYGVELPWSDARWCWFRVPKDKNAANILWSLTKESLVKASTEKTR